MTDKGSVYQQADGRWVATWWVPGHKRPRRATGKTREQAIDRRTKRKLAAGLNPGALATVGGLADWWLNNVQKHSVRQSSWKKSEERVRRINDTLGHIILTSLDYRTVTEWQAHLSLTLAPRSVRDHRQTLAQIIDEAVKLGTLTGNPVRTVRPPRATDTHGVALTPDETRRLLVAAAEHRFAAAIALLFLQGWRISEVLGLAWEDIDFDAQTAQLRRASVYVDGAGQQLGPPKTDGAHGTHFLMPTVVTYLQRRRELQDHDRENASTWTTHTYQNEIVNLVFTTPYGGLILRQTIAKFVKEFAKTAGISVTQTENARFSTHSGRRSVITALFVEGGEALEDIARFVGHSHSATTAGYVKRLGRRPQAVAERAAILLDPIHA